MVIDVASTGSRFPDIRDRLYGIGFDNCFVIDA